MRVPAFLTIAAAGLTAAATLATPAAAAPGTDARFIITVADAYDSRAVAAEHRRNGAEIDFVYTAALNGFAGAMSDAELGALQRDRRVTRIERDGIATASETTQKNATWGLDRVDQRALPLSSSYTYTPTGSGVKAYIIDTGIRFSHSDFGGRAVSGYDAVDGGTADDCNGHGTHVAGTVAGATWGVAKAATLVGVRVLDCSGSGTWSGVIAGMDWATADHAAGTPAVANMSLGGGANDSVDAAVQRMHDDGITVVVAAGNGNQAGKEQDACGYSPARVPDAVTIGATTNTDAKTSWSNYGPCVDLFAPGASITSAWYQSDTQTKTISGTSMAAPHVAGVAALYLEGNPAASPPTVRDTIYNTSTKGIVTSSKTANNHLVFSPLTAEGTVGNVAPTASFSVTCAGLTCDFTSTSSDSDGSIAGYAWTFGDGASSTVASPSHPYADGGTYTVALTVTDDDGATGTTSKEVTVSTQATGGITLSASGYKVKGWQWAKLDWSGATKVDIWFGTELIANGTTTDPYDHEIGAKGSGSYTYKVCDDADNTKCATATVTF